MKGKRPFVLFFKLALREIKRNWAQFLAIVSIGAIAVTLFVGLEANSVSLSMRVEETYERGKMADLWVTSSHYDEREEKAIRSLLAEGDGFDKRFEMSATAGSHSVVTAISESLPSISVPYDVVAEQEEDAYSFCYIDEALSSNDPAKKAMGQYLIGEDITLVYDLSSFSDAFRLLSDKLGFASYFADGKNPFEENKWSLSFPITGTMKYPENIAKASYNTSTILISSRLFLSSLRNDFVMRFRTSMSESDREKALLTMAEVFSELGYLELSETGDFQVAPNQYLIKIADKSRLDSLEYDLSVLSKSPRFSILNVSGRKNMPFFLTISNEIAQAEGFTYLFPFVFFFVAVLIILVTTSEMIIKERLQIGTLKALGVKRNGILLFYAGLICSLVFMGILIGEILGPIIVPAIMSNKYSLIYTLPALTYIFPVAEGLLSAGIFLSVSALTSCLVVWKEAKAQPSECMRPAAISYHNHSKKKKKGKESALLLSVKMAFRNIRVNLAKSLMVVVGVMGCTALLLTGYGIEDTVNYGIAHDLAKVGNCDLTLSFNEAKKKEDFASDISLVRAVSDFELYSSLVGTVSSSSKESMNTTIYLLGDIAHTHFTFASGLSDDEVTISNKVQETLSLKVGDTISFTINGLKYSSRIASVYEAFFYGGIAISSSNKAFQGKAFSYNGAYLDLQSGSDVDEVRETLQKNFTYFSSIQSKEDWERKINDVLQGILVMTGAVKVFAILLAVVALYNLSLLNFNERTRDIATLKVLGFNLSEIVMGLLVETMTLTLAGVLMGLCLGYPFLLAVMGLNKVELVTYLYHIYPLSYLYSFLLSFVVAFIVNLCFGFRSRKIKMVESLKSIE